MCHFIDRQTKKFRDAGYSADEALSGVKDGLGQFWTDISQARMFGRTAVEAADKTEMTARVLWALLGSHKVLAEYKRLRFKDHPSMAASTVRWLLNKSPHKTLSKLDKEIATLKDRNTKLNSSVESLTSRLKNLEIKVKKN